MIPDISDCNSTPGQRLSARQARTAPLVATFGDWLQAQRRKTSRNAFAEWAGSGNASAERLLAASIAPARRSTKTCACAIA